MCIARRLIGRGFPRKGAPDTVYPKWAYRWGGREGEKRRRRRRRLISPIGRRRLSLFRKEAGKKDSKRKPKDGFAQGRAIFKRDIRYPSRGTPNDSKKDDREYSFQFNPPSNNSNNRSQTIPTGNPRYDVSGKGIRGYLA